MITSEKYTAEKYKVLSVIESFGNLTLVECANKCIKSFEQKWKTIFQTAMGRTIIRIDVEQLDDILYNKELHMKYDF